MFEELIGNISAFSVKSSLLTYALMTSKRNLREVRDFLIIQSLEIDFMIRVTKDNFVKAFVKSTFIYI